MAAPKQTHYEVLGVKPDAKLTEIGRAYNKLRSALHHETAAPDPRRAALVEAAYQALSDEARRAEYDATLAAPERKRRARGAALVLGGILVLGGTAGASWYFLGSQPPAPPTGKPIDEIRQAASLAVGRLDRIDMSGASSPVGVAFAVDEGSMVTACNGITPGAQYVVHLSPRNVAARIATSDEALGLCQLSVDGVGASPLQVSGAEPRKGDKIYATKINAVGEVTLIEGSVKRVATEEGGRVIEASMPVAPVGGGAPLLDIYGRVVGVASISKDGRARHIPVPHAWTAEGRPAVRVTTPEPAPAAGQPKPAPELSMPPRSVNDISPERRERLEKAFRPPPTVPDDL